MTREERLERIRLGRVSLRRPRLEDHAAYVHLLRTSEDFHRPWFPSQPPGHDPASPAAFEHLVRANGMVSRRERRFIVGREGDELLGMVNLSEIVRGSFQSCYLGYWIGVEHAGRGHMTEALCHTVELAFTELRLHRIEANIRPENEPSLRVIQRLGFQREGYSPRYLEIDGEWRDHERWALLSDA
jgi:ribosomal-protein-alanine N-acetyltransferase